MINICIHIYTHIHIYIHIYIYTYIYIYIYFSSKGTKLLLQVIKAIINQYSYTYIYMNIHMYTYIHVYIEKKCCLLESKRKIKYDLLHIYIYIHIYICIYIHINITIYNSIGPEYSHHSAQKFCIFFLAAHSAFFLFSPFVLLAVCNSTFSVSTHVLVARTICKFLFSIFCRCILFFLFSFCWQYATRHVASQHRQPELFAKAKNKYF